MESENTAAVSGSNRIEKAAEVTLTAVRQAAVTLWRAVLAEADAQMRFAQMTTTPAIRRRGRPPASAPSAAAPRTVPAAASPRERVYAYIGARNGIAAGDMAIAGMRPNIVASLCSRLATAGRIEQRGGLWYVCVPERAAQPAATATAA